MTSAAYPAAAEHQSGSVVPQPDVLDFAGSGHARCLVWLQLSPLPCTAGSRVTSEQRSSSARRGQLLAPAAGAATPSPDAGAAALLAAALFAGDFLATAFDEVAFLTATTFFAALDFFAAFLTGALATEALTLVARTTFLAAAFAFVATFRPAFLATFFAGALGASELVADASVPPMRNLSRFLADAIHAGGLPIPVQVLPVLGSSNFGTPAPARLAGDFLAGVVFFPTTAILTVVAALETLEPRCSIVTPSDAIRLRTLATELFISTSVRRAALASSAAICRLISDTVSLAMVYTGVFEGLKSNAAAESTDDYLANRDDFDWEFSNIDAQERLRSSCRMQSSSSLGAKGSPQRFASRRPQSVD